MRNTLRTAVRLVAALATVASIERRAHADEPPCDGSEATPAQHAVCRAGLEVKWRAAVVAEQGATAARDAPTPANVGVEEASAIKAAALKKLEAAQRTRHAIELSLEVEAMRTAYDANHCARSLTICLDRGGELISVVKPAEALPGSVHTGDKLTVLVLTSQHDEDHKVVTVSFEGRRSLDALFPAAVDAAARARGLSATAAKIPDDPPLVEFLPLSFVSDPAAADLEDLTISFQRTPGKAEPGAETQYVVSVDRGHSYYSVAFLLAATYKADRQVLRDLATTSDHAVDPGLALNIFPFGRQQGVIGYLRKCPAVGLRRCLANTVGFQIGTDLDLTNPTDKLYVGLVFEPVAGLALVGGVSLREVAVVPPAGALPALEAMDGAAPTDTRYVARGYVGVTITLDLLETISATGTKIRGVKVP
jgi:hypothetical protein